MGFRPGGPEEGYFGAGRGGGYELGGCCGDVAGYGGGCEVCYGAVAGGGEGPYYTLGDRGFVGVLEDEVAGVVLGVDGEVLDDAVGCSESQGGEGSEDKGLHVDGKLLKEGNAQRIQGLMKVLESSETLGL